MTRPTKRKKSIYLAREFEVVFLTFSGEYVWYSCVFNVREDEPQVFGHSVMVEALRPLGALHEPKYILTAL